ncbi:MAG: hypothetical protein AABX04_01500 [Nanoarchaeota archaeon]
MAIDEICLLAYVSQKVRLYDSKHNLSQMGVLVPTQEGETRAK